MKVDDWSVLIGLDERMHEVVVTDPEALELAAIKDAGKPVDYVAKFSLAPNSDDAEKGALRVFVGVREMGLLSMGHDSLQLEFANGAVPNVYGLVRRSPGEVEDLWQAAVSLSFEGGTVSSPLILPPSLNESPDRGAGLGWTVSSVVIGARGFRLVRLGYSPAFFEVNMAVFSLLFGLFGGDRFLFGQYITGILKMVTVGGFGVWWIWDTVTHVRGAIRHWRNAGSYAVVPINYGAGGGSVG